jgi:RNA polymerase sigma-70 factor (ECF subfamily)
LNFSGPNTDQELFLQIAEGNETAFTELFNKYADLLYWHAYKLLHSEFWAEETVQEVFLQLWANKSSLRQVESPASYLYRVAANRAFDRIRRQELEVKMQYFVQQQLHPPEDKEPSAKADERLNEQLFEQAVESLPEQRKLVFRLKYQQDLSYGEIAGKLNITKHTVRNQLAAALKTLRSTLLEKNDLLGVLLIFFLKIFSNG